MNQMWLRQSETAVRLGAGVMLPSSEDKVGIARNVRADRPFPLNALRHSPRPGVSGWYIWAGQELSGADDFFEPLHISHLDKWCPEIVPYLGLEPGWRVLLAPGYEDAWFDPSLLG